MKQLNLFIKGICIGIANVIPGLCSGLVAIILKVYDLYLYVFGEIFVHPIKVIKKSYGFILGIIAGLILAMFLILRLLERWPLEVIMLFVGLVMGSISDSYKERMKYGKIKAFDVFIIIISFSLMILLTFLKTSASKELSNNIDTVIILFGLGIISSVAMIIPGLSGSLILMSLGYYVPILEVITSVISRLFSLSFSLEMINKLIILIIFASGFIIGLIIITKIISTILINFPRQTSSIIIGLVMASPVVIIYNLLINYSISIDYNGLTIILKATIFIIMGSLMNIIIKKINPN